MVKLKHPVQQTKTKQNKTIFSWAYPDDIDQAYAFYCARYENISWEAFLNLGFFEVKKKMGSIPEDEPLFKIIKSRTINVNKIKDKEERKYWQELKRINEIPQIYLPISEIDQRLNEFIKKKKGL
mgnify:CR=1 FL=1